ncbi:hypothetical protein AB0L04_10355 [Streptomyces glaucescens]|uniref:hypothetical protein n=1 Tax=Streptomyces glaucescens TaxID=1907 RepID=UPI00344F9D15
MTGKAGTTGVHLARLLLLGLLLVGLGVVHTLAHADAHDGLTGHTTAHHLDLDTAAELGSVGASGEPPHHTTAVITADPDSLPEADCWVSVPTGSWPVVPARCGAGTTPLTQAAPPAGGQPSRHTLAVAFVGLKGIAQEMAAQPGGDGHGHSHGEEPATEPEPERTAPDDHRPEPGPAQSAAGEPAASTPAAEDHGEAGHSH